MNGLIRWFAHNHVAANLLMLVIIAAGFMSAVHIKQEVFPEVVMDMITVQVPYLGATPSEVEEAVCVRVEEQVQGVDGIKKITSTSSEGIGMVSLELESNADKRKVLDEVKAEVDRIITCEGRITAMHVALLVTLRIAGPDAVRRVRAGLADVGQRPAGLALLRHREAVDDGRRVGAGAGNAEQDRRDRSAAA